MTPSHTPLEPFILSQLEEIEHKMAELRDEKAALQRLLTKARQRDFAIKDVTRKNSLGRIVVENKILEILRDARGAISARELYDAAVSVSFDLKDNTFRSYLHRLKARGLIAPSASQRGYWQAVSQTS